MLGDGSMFQGWIYMLMRTLEQSWAECLLNLNRAKAPSPKLRVSPLRDSDVKFSCPPAVCGLRFTVCCSHLSFLSFPFLFISASKIDTSNS